MCVCVRLIRLLFFLQANVEAKFVVRPVNNKGEIQRVYVQMQAMIKGPDGKPIKTLVTSQENGTYEITCTPPR